MERVEVADAKVRLNEIVKRAAAGETICITRNGAPLARPVAAEQARKPIDVDALRALTDSMPRQAESAGKVVRRMRDGERY
jgi:prevent-host-death family protein